MKNLRSEKGISLIVLAIIIIFVIIFIVAMSQPQDGIGTVEEETKKLEEMQKEKNEADDNYLKALNNASESKNNLEQLESQYNY